MLRAAQAAQDGGDKRLQKQVEDDDEDESQCIFHNPELISFPFCSGLSGPRDAYFFLLSENESCRWRQAGGGQYVPMGGRLSDSPARRFGLTYRWMSLDLQEEYTLIPGRKFI